MDVDHGDSVHRTSAPSVMARGPGDAPGQESPGPLWAAHLKDLTERLQSCPPDSETDQLQGEIWLLLNSAIRRYLRYHGTRCGHLPVEDQEDIAARSALDLLRKIVSGRWRHTERHPAEIAGYLSAVARNNLINELKRTRRKVDPGQDERHVDAAYGCRGAQMAGERPETLTDLPILRREFAHSLRDCVTRLAPRARQIWLLRVFLQLPTKSIASHPDVRLKPGHVDVLFQRARRAIQDCMSEHGYHSGDMPAGTFAEIWRTFQIEMVRHD